MSIRQDCGDFMEAQLGHAVSDKQLGDIEARVTRNMRKLAEDDREAWSKLPYHERVQRGAAAAAKEMKEEFARKKLVLQKQIDAHQRVESVLAAAPDRKAGDGLSAVSRLLDWDTRGGEYTSVDSWANAVRKESNSNLIALWHAIPGKAFGLFENRQGVKDLWKELHGESSGNATARKAAEAWKTVTNELRERFNAAGGDVGKLEDWGMPQHHSQERVGAAGIDKWIADTLPKLARDKYLNIDGSRMNDEQMHDFLGHAYDSIITDGWNSKEPGNVAGSGMIANRNSASRAIHFKDSDSHAAYNSLYGEKSLSGILTGHISRLSRDIALAERLGPNAEKTFRYFNDRTLTDELRADPTKKSKLMKEHTFNEALFSKVAGQDRAVNINLARKSQAFRNFMTAVKLPKVVITALGDESGMMATAFANKVPYTAAFVRELKTLNPLNKADRSAAEHAGLGLEAMLDHMNRFGQEEFNPGFTGKMASSVMRLSGAERMWAARRQGLGTVLMSSIGRLTREHASVDALSVKDHGVIAQKGITDKIWQVWRRAETEDWGTGAHSVLTHQGIWSIPDEQLRDLGDPRALKREASTQLLAHVGEESGMGAMDTGPRQQVRVNLGTKAGTAGGEIWRAMNLFRGFAFSMMMKHWGRAASMDGVGRAKYLGALGLYGTLIAAAGNQIRNLVSGKDPESMALTADNWKFWGKALLRGGGLGFFGDFLYNEMTQNDTSLAAAVGGPALTEAEDLYKITAGAAQKAAQGKRVDEGANVIRFIRGNTPYTGLWYMQAAWDHLLWNHLQEAASPGYLSRMQARAEKYGQQYYWNPDESAPARAPQFARAISRPDTEIASR